MACPKIVQDNIGCRTEVRIGLVFFGGPKFFIPIYTSSVHHTSIMWSRNAQRMQNILAYVQYIKIRHLYFSLTQLDEEFAEKKATVIMTVTL